MPKIELSSNQQRSSERETVAPTRSDSFRTPSKTDGISSSSSTLGNIAQNSSAANNNPETDEYVLPKANDVVSNPGLVRRSAHPAQQSSDNLYQMPLSSGLTINTGTSSGGTTITDNDIKMHSIPYAHSLIPIYSPINGGNNPVNGKVSTLSRKNTLKRNGSIVVPPKKSILAKSEISIFDPWRLFVYLVTCCCWPSCLKTFKMENAQIQQAWREKIALCFISAVLCVALGFLTFGLQRTICYDNVLSFPISSILEYKQGTKGQSNRYIIHGDLYDMSGIMTNHSSLPKIQANPTLSSQISGTTAKDITPLFPKSFSSCAGVLRNYTTVCRMSGYDVEQCHSLDNSNTIRTALKNTKLGPVVYDWSQVVGSKKLMIYKSIILDMSKFLDGDYQFFENGYKASVERNIGKDSSFFFGGNSRRKQIGDCMADMYGVGQLQDPSIGCITNQIILYISLIIILTVVLVRFILAVAFSWLVSKKLGRIQKNQQESAGTRKSILAEGNVPFPMFHLGEYQPGPSSSTLNISEKKSPRAKKRNSKKLQKPIKSQSEYGKELHAIMLVTCYSEGYDGLKTTFDSLGLTKYNEDFKLLFIVADGIITGSGNLKSTPELIIDMLELDKSWPNPPPALSYFSLADGSREHNKAQVYAAWYNVEGRSVPTILVVKCGTEEESKSPKPGNRGKRDSQMILMHFLEKVNFNSRMCPLEYELFQKIHYLMGVTPDKYEIVLMVDADTKVAPDSLARMVACMADDPLIMGLCGETRIANKSESLITRIQVFEYFISQHLNKAFESIFGNVTCLPGCFCMYRIKAPKGDGYWTPILTNPDIINTYSERFVDTLHKKNLLLLGEDRFLTTLMLRTFPRRKLIFVPRAFCKTTVPAEFMVLLSQRRRWINSTIHNLMELVLVRDLCGVFCFSIQFVIILELIGTVTLPAAIIFTIYLIVLSILGDPQIVPLILLAAILGLPAILILFTTRRLIYIYWMLIYLVSLPIWNFVLPLYAFWHFDDFSWGETRKVSGESNRKDGHGNASNDGAGIELKSGDIQLKKWVEWESERRKEIKRILP